MTAQKVLFICTHNSARSQIAEGLLRTKYNEQYDVHSAGTQPTQVSPYAIEVMKEIGIDITDQRSKSIKEFQHEHFDIVVTVCNHAKETCPYFPGKKVMHKGFTDPGETDGSIDEILSSFRKIRDQIAEWITKEFSKQ